MFLVDGEFGAEARRPDGESGGYAIGCGLLEAALLGTGLAEGWFCLVLISV